MQQRLLALCTLPVWPVRDGYSLRVYHLLRGLAARWAITLVAPGTPPPGIVALHVPLPLQGHGLTYPWRFDPAPLHAAVDAALAGEQPHRALVWPGAERAWLGRRGLPPAVMDMIDCNALEFARGTLRAPTLRGRASQARELALAALYGARTLRAFSATVCVGARDAAWLRATGLGGNVHVVANGVEIPPDPPPEAPCPTVGFTGALDFEPNVTAALWAADAIWPLVRAALPEARFVIAGRNPIPAIAALAQRPGIEVLADVPDMASVLGGTWVAVAPMRSGAGIKNKVLEAWACARPAVMTPIAANGLPLPPDHRPLVQGAPAAQAAAISRLLNDRAARHALGRSALAAVREHATWAAAAARLDALLTAAGR